MVEIVEYAKRINRRFKKDLSFVVCTNLSLINKEILSFLKKHNVEVSTSLDGPKIYMTVTGFLEMVVVVMTCLSGILK